MSRALIAIDLLAFLLLAFGLWSLFVELVS